MNEDFWELARDCYGYGDWNGRYWFVGPEQGGDEKEIQRRAAAFRKLNKEGLCDCREFHREIYEPPEKDWFRQERLPPLQATWFCMMLTLMSYEGDVGTEKPARGPLLRAYQRPFREYQRDHWGRSNGATCVIERSGVPARNFNESASTKSALSPAERCQLEELLRERVEQITDRICKSKPEPEFVVIYGRSQHQHWGELLGKCSKVAETPNAIYRLGETFIALTESPGKDAPGHARWLALGQELRKHRGDTHRD